MTKITKRGVALLVAVAAAVLAVVAGPRTPHIDGNTSGDADLAARVRSLLPDDAGLEALHVSVISPEGVRHAGLGSSDGVVPDEHSRFGLGSVTKTFNGQLLAVAIARGEVAESDTLATHIPELEGSQAGTVTLLELATHTSGLPREARSDWVWPWVSGSESASSGDRAPQGEQEFLRQARTLTLSTRGTFSYSNLGADLLGIALARAAGAASWQDYATARLLQPLGMNDTVFTSVDDAVTVPERAIKGKWENGRTVMPGTPGQYDLPAGHSTWTTGADMARYAQAVMDGTAPGGTTAWQPRQSINDTLIRSATQIGYLWMRWRLDDDRSAIYHGGGLPWYGTVVIMDPASGRAVVVMANTALARLDSLAQALLDDSQDPVPSQASLGAGMTGFIPYYSLALAAVLVALSLWAAWRAERLGSRLATVIRTVDVLAWAALAAALGPWIWVPGWTYALMLLPGAYAIVRMALRWRELPWQPGPGKLRWWLWARLVPCVAFAVLVLLVVMPKG